MPPPDESLIVSEEDTPRPQDQAESTINAALDAKVVSEEEGRLLDLSKQTGIDRDTLRYQSMPHLSSLENLPTRTDVFNRQRDIAQWFVDNPVHAAIGHDDTAALENIKKSMPDWLATEQTRDPTGFLDRSAATLADFSSKSLVGGAGQVYRGAYGIVHAGADLFGADRLANFAADQSEIGNNLRSHVRAAVRGESLDNADQFNQQLERMNLLKMKIGSAELSAGDVGAGLVSIVPTLLAGPLGWGAILGAAGAQTFGGAYEDLKDRGDTGAKAGAIALVEGVITAALTHYIPGAEGAIRRMLASSTAKTVTARAIFAQAIGRPAAGEMLEEGLDQFAQTFLNDVTDTKNPKDFKTTLGHAVSESIKAGLIGGFTGGIFAVGEARHAAAVQQAINFHEQNSKLAAAVDQSQMGQRSKVAMNEFLQGQGMRADSSVHITGEDAKALLSGGAEETRALANIGITVDSVEAARARGGSLAVRASDLMTSSPTVRDRILELGRQTPSSMNKVEADEAQKELDAHKGDVKEEKTRTAKFVKELRREQDRIIKQAVAATGQDEKTVRALHQPLFERAKVAFLRDPLAAKSPVEFLKKIQFNKKGMSREEAMQAITDLAGPNGKTALSKVNFKDLGQLSGRFDVLTGQLDVNDKALPDTVGLAEILSTAKAATLDIAGKTVTVPDAAGKRVSVDAAAAVGTLRQRVEAARRLAACL